MAICSDGFSQVFSLKENFAWELKEYDRRSCEDFDQLLAESKFFIRKKGQDLYLFTPDARPIVQFITGPKDGMALEKVFRSSYDHDSEILGRNKGSSIFNGTVLKPVYKDDLYDDLADHFRLTEYDTKALKNQPRPLPYWMSYLGLDTLSNEGQYEYNVLFIKDGSLCQVKYHRNTPGAIHDFYEGVSILSEWPEVDLKIIPILKSFSFQIPFERGQTTITNENEALYTDVLQDFIVKGVKIWAYASVEGSAELNEALQNQRAENIMAGLKKYLPEDVVYRTIAKENWEEFNDQLKGTSKDSLRLMSRSEIRDLLKKEDNLSTFNQELYDQRKAVVKVFYNTKPEDYDTVRILEHNFLQALDSIVQRQKTNRRANYYVRDAEGIYSWLYEEMLKNKISEDDFMKWSFPLDLSYRSMINNKFWYQYHHNEFIDPMTDNYIKLVGLDQYASDVERFNLINYFFEKEQKGENESGLTLEDLGRLMRSRAYHMIPTEGVLKIAIPLFANLAIHYNQDFNSWNLRDQMLNDMITIFDQDSIKSSEEWLKLAEFSARLNNSFVAHEIVDRFKDTDKGYLKLDLQLNYDHWFSKDSLFNSEQYYKQLIGSFETLGQTEWCDLFSDDGISFQALDNPELWSFFQQKCSPFIEN